MYPFILIFLMAIGIASPILPVQAEEGGLTLDAAVKQAIASDPWLTGSRQRETALENDAISAGTLPDPKMTLTAGNLPTDTFNIHQESMTQLSVGISQMFPRGNTRPLTRRQKRQLASQQPLLRLDRTAKVISTVSQLWLKAYKAQESIRFIQNDRGLFEQLVDAAAASYSSALGHTRQQDVIRAQLELTRLDDRLTTLRQQQEAAQRRLSEWIGSQASAPLAQQRPALRVSVPGLIDGSETHDAQTWFEQLRRHPAILALDRRIEATATGIALAQQKYQPEWGLRAQYGYRGHDPTGRDRADLFSIGVTFDLPLFTANRQDKQVGAAVARTEAMKTDRLLMLRKLMARLESARVQLQRLDERQTLYERQLLPQMAEQAEASLTAYDNDDGDFAEAVRARIAELNAKIDALGIAVERQTLIVRINYLLAQAASSDEAVAPSF